MWIRRQASLVLVLIAAACAPASAAEDSTLNPDVLRQNLKKSIGHLPWNLSDGYILQGQFVLKATGDEINYTARCARSFKGWAADFSQENQSRNVRFVLSDNQAWVSSPEITLDAVAASLPYTTRYDFPLLYNELLRILEKGKTDPRFAMGNVGNEIYIRGRLQNGWEAVFTLNTVEYFPRKVFITTVGQPSSAWMLAFARPDGTGFLVGAPALSTEFEIWFSDPVDAGGYRFARRMDFAEHGNVIGTFSFENVSALSASVDLFERPPKFPWLKPLSFTPRANPPSSSLYLDEPELPEFRSRLEQRPWSDWNNKSRIVAYWASLIPWIGFLIPHSVPLKWVASAVAISFLIFVLLLFRRSRQVRKFSWGSLIMGFILSCLVVAAAIASLQLHRSQDRSLLALHCALRFTATGHSFYAARTDTLLRQFARQAPARSIEDLGLSCQAFALAYDLIRSKLSNERRIEIEEALFNYAKPLFGASCGWISNTDSSCVLASGLGMIGLATGYEPFVTSACAVIDRTLDAQLVGGLHRSGPGQGSVALDSAANLFYGLKHLKRIDYYSRTSFRQYVRATLQMLSPVGTLPLFGDTNLDQPARLSMFFMKIANQLPAAEAGQCVAAHDLYWAFGQHRSKGLTKRLLPVVQPLMTYYENPYVLIQYTRAMPASPLPAFSAVLGKGQSAILRAGGGPDSAYLALNMPLANLYTSPRDILAFDFYAYRSLLLHGPGFPGKDNSGYQDTRQTAAHNSITLNNENQSGTQCSGIESSLLNQPLFDYISAFADKTYDYGQVQRDIVMVRPERNHSAYFFLVDNVSVSDPGTTVQWHLHGSGELVTGIDQVSRWTNTPFNPPRWRSESVRLEAAHPIGFPGTQTSRTGRLYSQISFLTRESKSSVIEWAGSKRFCTVLFPYKSGASPKIETLGKSSSRVDATDWISLGTLEGPANVGAITHVSEFIIVRERAKLFPALMMVSGLEFQLGSCSLFSTKPVTVSLNGLHGAFLNFRPDTQVEIHAPEIGAGDSFVLDGKSISATEPGILILNLSEPGEHAFRRASNS